MDNLFALAIAGVALLAAALAVLDLLVLRPEIRQKDSPAIAKWAAGTLALTAFVLVGAADSAWNGETRPAVIYLVAAAILGLIGFRMTQGAATLAGLNESVARLEVGAGSGVATAYGMQHADDLFRAKIFVVTATHVLLLSGRLTRVGPFESAKLADVVGVATAVDLSKSTIRVELADGRQLELHGANISEAEFFRGRLEDQLQGR